MLIVTWNWVWNFIQMIPPREIWHITLKFQIKILKIFGWNLHEVSFKEIPPWEISHNTSIPNQICSIFDFWLHSKIPPWEIWHITLQFQIKILQICAYFWLKLVSKDTSLRDMMCNSSIQNHIFMNFCLLLVEIEYEFSFKWYLLEKYDT